MLVERTSDREWSVLLHAPRDIGFDAVNVLVRDLSADERPEIVYAFRGGDHLWIDVVDPLAARVVAHHESSSSRAAVVDGTLTVWAGSGTTWRTSVLVTEPGTWRFEETGAVGSPPANAPL